MKKSVIIFSLITLFLFGNAVFATVVDELIKGYQETGAGNFDASRGEAMWNKPFSDAKAAGKIRSCTSCHTANIADTGKHVTTGKLIKPMSPSVNNSRLTDPKKVEKWFLRNCKWTVGRECTPQEKGDFLIFLRSK
ncbi:MAG: DUF1924 domain-containing protein [Gammaproteobacteria bacterium]|nr:DUF1924 domain-containing protein [Gammaproteobacteria bacterium]